MSEPHKHTSGECYADHNYSKPRSSSMPLTATERGYEIDLAPILNEARAEAWDEGARSSQCRCAAFSESECACGEYPSDRNPYRT